MKRILVVDDTDAFRRPLVQVLELAGYEVRTAADGTAALELYHQEPFDLVVMDLIMPGKEGLETIIELHRIAPGLKIVAMSGGGRIDADDYLPMARRLGACETLRKPFTVSEILQKVAVLLGES